MLALFFCGTSRAQDDRRARREPGLILETGGRTGACDVLRFTKDGNTLFAVGDDRVARSWTVKPNELVPHEPLRWSVWRQMRGVIYTMAISPDESKIAVAGCGVRNGSVSVIDRATGKVLSGLIKKVETGSDGKQREITITGTIWAIAFSPSGEQLAIGDANGQVWLWRWQSLPTELRNLGTHGSKVRAFKFDGEHKLLSIAADGPAIEWDTVNHQQRDVKLFSVWDGNRGYREQIVASACGKWFASVTQSRDVPVQVAAADGSALYSPRLGLNEEGQGIALSPDGSSLAVACRTVPHNDRFIREIASRVVIFDRTPQGNQQRFEIPIPKVAERVAWHPDGKRLAVAGGEDHEITLWDVSRLKPELITTAVGVGKCMWGVGFSKDGTSFGWQDQYQPAPSHPNQLGRGPWHVFDMQKRVVVPGDKFQPVRPIETQAGWRVQPHPTDTYHWDVVGPDGQTHKLPLDWSFDDRPRCYTFLPQNDGKPPRLAIGHYWGISLFELTPAGAKRLWLGHGHQGYVSSIAPSADGRLLLSASRDQTIACWTADPGANSFGADYRTGLGRIFVDKVRPGSPAWEAGMARGDEIIVFAYGGGEFVWDPERKTGRPNATADVDACIKVMNAAAPNKEMYFLIQREGRTQELNSSLRQRPLWCFFPTRTNEWVLWRFFDYIYDASPGGDAYVGWQIGLDCNDTPAFYPARGFSRSDQFHQPKKVAELLQEGRYDPERVRLPDLEPPNLTVKLIGDRPDGVTLDLQAEPRGQRDVFQVESAVLWVNDYRFRTWEKPSDGKLSERVVIPASELRPGLNRLSWQVTCKAGTTDRRQILVDRRRIAGEPKRYALLAGVADYRSTVPRPGEKTAPWRNLDSIRIDLVRLESILQRNGYDVTTLEDSKATPEAVRTALSSYEGKLGPNDVFLLYIAGHGWVEEQGGKAGTFVFVGPNFDFARPSQTGLPTDVLNDHLARIRGRKVVMLMTCHSGDALRGSLRDPVRELTPGGVGPVVIAACAARESALVHPTLGSLFQVALRAEVAGKPRFTANELAEAIQSRVPKILAEWKQADLAEPNPDKRLLPPDLIEALQMPCMFAPDPEVGHTIVIGK